MCAILPLEGENLSYSRLKFSSQIKRRELLHKSSRANALPGTLLFDLKLTNPKSFTLEKPYFNSVKRTSS